MACPTFGIQGRRSGKQEEHTTVSWTAAWRRWTGTGRTNWPENLTVERYTTRPPQRTSAPQPPHPTRVPDSPAARADTPRVEKPLVESQASRSRNFREGFGCFCSNFNRVLRSAAVWSKGVRSRTPKLLLFFFFFRRASLVEEMRTLPPLRPL